MTDASPLNVLLVEDNPGDARYIEEILNDARELSDRELNPGGEILGQQQLGDRGDELELIHESRLADGLERLDEQRRDVVLLDLDLPDSQGLETLERVVNRTETVPIVVLTGLRDREVGLEALRRGAEEYLVKDEINSDLLVRSVYHAIERKARERQLERHREQLAALNQLNGVVREITDAVIDQSTREEIERTVCEALADSASYEFAWVGELDAATDEFELRAEAGVEGYLDDITITADEDDPQGRGPTGRAFRSREIQVTRNVAEDYEYEPWREYVKERGARSSAAIPIVHEGTIYGVLNVYADRPDAFADRERQVIGQLGEIVGHAIAAVERKRALLSDEVIEANFRVEDVFAEFDVEERTDDEIRLEQVVPAGGDEYLAYGSTPAGNDDALKALVDALPAWESIRILDDDLGRLRFEIRFGEPSVQAAVATHGGYVEAATIEGGDFHLAVQLPQGADVRQIVEVVQESYPTAELRAQRQVTRDDAGTNRMLSAFHEDLTDRQRTVVKTAYYAGYFEWPRDSSGEEIAESLDIAPATFSQHLRTAENRIFGALFQDPDEE
ncbi:MAG TPA: bacterio-opsin activator domain-containing protein [Natronoarchaeum rubrum]|nr:bacterio-opsin activator domain-containing protein [Natronoarchaeum rubrum]